MTKKMRCGKCGSRNSSLKSAKGHTFPYKSYIAVKLDCDVELLTCDDCGNIMMSSGDSEKLTIGLEESLVSQSKQYIGSIVGRTKWSQLEMADYLGFTPEYISELKNGKKIAEFRTYSYLKVLSLLPGAIELVTEQDKRVELPRWNVPAGSVAYATHIASWIPPQSAVMEETKPVSAKKVYQKKINQKEIILNRKTVDLNQAAESNDYGYALAA